VELSSVLANFVRHIDPELHSLTAFALGAVAEGSLREVGSQITKNVSGILEKAINVYGKRNDSRMLSDCLNQCPLDARAEFLRKASFVFDEEAQEQWANLLCSFVEDPQRYAKVKFVSILNDLDGLDALVLKRIYALSLVDSKGQHETEIRTGDLPVAARCADSSQAENSAPASPPSSAVQISLENLERLSLIRSATFWTGPSYSVVYRTRLGSEFANSLHIDEQL
jgi:Abortive infection alpha